MSSSDDLEHFSIILSILCDGHKDVDCSMWPKPPMTTLVILMHGFARF
jgi:hypothetical protein